jgi:uncharacterized tellurite resistance protein B-like protein
MTTATVTSSSRQSNVVEADVVTFFEEILGEKINPQDITPSIRFIAALIVILMGVMFADQTVTDEEKQHWQKTLNYFIPKDGEIRKFVQALSKGIRQAKSFAKLNSILTLTATFSPSEKLLLVGFGYQLSCADGEMDERELEYLRRVAKALELEELHIQTLEAILTERSQYDAQALAGLRFLLDPARFHELELVFVNVASELLEMLPSAADVTKPDVQSQGVTATSYAQLAKFQASRTRISQVCDQLVGILQDCVDHQLIQEKLVSDADEINEKLQSQTFQIAVLGEFSQGKSTLLNALLGEKIQPVRAIPCSGTISRLRYGPQKRVICVYRDGTQKEVSLEEYGEMAAIPRDVAQGESLSDVLVQQDIQELIFEHPDLDLCKNGVEILDSPGLNEHPERTEITYKLLAGTDAAIFLGNAARPLTETERNLLQDIRYTLNAGNSEKPAQNLFVVVNFMDLLEEEDDRRDVIKRFENLVTGTSPIITGIDRLHFISAKSALNAKLQGHEDKYLQAFCRMTGSIEQFLVSERGRIEIERGVDQLKQQVTQSSLNELQLALQVAEGKITASEAEKQQILEQIGEATGRYTKIEKYANTVCGEVYSLVREAFSSWYVPEWYISDDEEGEQASDAEDNNYEDAAAEDEYFWHRTLVGRVFRQSEHWTSEHSSFWSSKEVIADYSQQFANTLNRELEKWGKNTLENQILRPSVQHLDKKIKTELESLRNDSKNLSEDMAAKFNYQLELTINSVEDECDGGLGFFGGAGVGVALAAGLLAFTGVGLVAGAIAGAIAVGSSFLGALTGGESAHEKLKRQVIIHGFQKFDESLEQMLEHIESMVDTAFDQRLDLAQQAIETIIRSYEDTLQQQEHFSQLTTEETEKVKALIAQKSEEIAQVQAELDAILQEVVAGA